MAAQANKACGIFGLFLRPGGILLQKRIHVPAASAPKGYNANRWTLCCNPLTRCIDS